MTTRRKPRDGSDGAGQSRGNKPATLRGHLKPHFLAAMKELKTGNIYDAAARVGVDPNTVTRWKKDDAAFLEAFTEIEINCKTRDNEMTRSTALRLCNEGSPKYLIKDGQMVPQIDAATGEPLRDASGNVVFVVVERRFDGGLIQFMLERRIPEEFSNNIKTQVAAGVIAAICSLFMSAVRRIVPEFCPHCKTHLGLHAEIAKELETQSAKLPVT